MHSEPAIENRPVFVDNSGRRSRLLRRIGLLGGVLCLGYAVVLGLAFLGIGTATPSSLLPFAGGGPAGARDSRPGGSEPQGGIGTPPARPTGTPPNPAPSASATASATTSATTAG